MNWSTQICYQLLPSRNFHELMHALRHCLWSSCRYGFAYSWGNSNRFAQLRRWRKNQDRSCNIQASWSYIGAMSNVEFKFQVSRCVAEGKMHQFYWFRLLRVLQLLSTIDIAVKPAIQVEYLNILIGTLSQQRQRNNQLELPRDVQQMLSTEYVTSSARAIIDTQRCCDHKGTWMEIRWGSWINNSMVLVFLTCIWYIINIRISDLLKIYEH